MFQRLYYVKTKIKLTQCSSVELGLGLSFGKTTKNSDQKYSVLEGETAAQPGAEEEPQEGQVPGHQVLFSRNQLISYFVGRYRLREAVHMVSLDQPNHCGYTPCGPGVACTCSPPPRSPSPGTGKEVGNGGAGRWASGRGAIGSSNHM